MRATWSVFVVLITVLLALSQVLQHPIRLAAQQFAVYVVPETLQTLAASKEAYRNYQLKDRPEDKALYLDLLTLVGILASERAKRQSRKPTEDDYALMLYLTCQPGDPPKATWFKEEALKIRRPLASGAYTSASKRQDILRRIKPPLLTLSAADVKSGLNDREKGMQYFLDVSDLLK